MTFAPPSLVDIPMSGVLGHGQLGVTSADQRWYWECGASGTPCMPNPLGVIASLIEFNSPTDAQNEYKINKKGDTEEISNL